MSALGVHRKRFDPVMWLTACGLAVILGPAAVAAQARQSSQPADTSSSEQAEAKPATSLPVSLEDIRRGLARAESGEGLRGLNQTPQFKVEIIEKAQNWVNPFAPEDFSSPTVGQIGNYAYELQQVMFPKTDYPLAQPYAAFSQGELLQVSITTLLQQLLTPKLIDSLQQAQKQRSKEAAREELQRALQEYCAAQPNGGAGVFGCNP